MARKILVSTESTELKPIQGSLAIEGKTLNTDQITVILEGKLVIAPINKVQEV